MSGNVLLSRASVIGPLATESESEAAAWCAARVQELRAALLRFLGSGSCSCPVSAVGGDASIRILGVWRLERIPAQRAHESGA